MRLFFLTLLILTAAYAAPVRAQDKENSSAIQAPFADDPVVEEPEQYTDPETGLVWQPPQEPSYPAVKYLKPEPPHSLQEKIDRLVQGVSIDLPPEYDHYGYEIRHYMAHVGNIKIFNDVALQEQELENIHKARIVYDYWAKDLTKQMHAIESEIEKNNKSSDIRSSYTYNKGVVAAFLAECRNWIVNNEALLDFLLEHKGTYSFNGEEFTFQDSGDQMRFLSIVQSREEDRKNLNKYQPFANMVY